MGRPREKKHFKTAFKKHNKKDGEKEKKPVKNVKPVRITKPQKTGKHKKLKACDPFYFGSRVADKKLEGANLKPKNAEQESSTAEKYFKEMMDLARTVPKSKLKGKKNPFERGPVEDRRGMKRKVKKAPRFIQGKHESEGQFLRRVDLTAKQAIAQAQFEQKFNVQLNASGKIIKERSKGAEKNTKRLQEKKQRKKEKKQQRTEDKQTGFEKYKDVVKFGEVAMEPPKLGAKPRNAPTDGGFKLAGGRSLLLSNIMRENESSGQNVAKTTRQLGETTKRKLLSPAQRVAMDTERDHAIKLYREMKAKKMAKQGL